MVSSEFISTTLLHSIIPELIVEPIAWGTYTTDPTTHFFACRYIPFKLSPKVPASTPMLTTSVSAPSYCASESDADEKHPPPRGLPESGTTTQSTENEDGPEDSDMVIVLPPPAALIPLVAKLHQRAVSPINEFGSLQITYGGCKPVFFPRSPSWEVSFRGGIAGILALEEETQGADPEMTRLREGLLGRVIPRLLRPLETGGRVLAATLVHGDLWDGNVGVDARSGRPVAFDALPLYAHNECKSPPVLQTLVIKSKGCFPSS